MFVVLLRFSDNHSAAGRHMEGHQRWLERGFADGVFLLVGSIQPGVGGAIVAHATPPEDLRRRVNEDPFVVEDVVRAEILEIEPGRTDHRLEFLAS